MAELSQYDSRVWEEAVSALAEAVSALAEAFWECSAALLGTFEALPDLVETAIEAQARAAERAAERARWGHPPAKLIHAYSAPVRKIRPMARSHLRR